MKFSDELKSAKRQHAEQASQETRTKREVKRAEFHARVERVCSNIDELKEAIKKTARAGGNRYRVMRDVATVSFDPQEPQGVGVGDYKSVKRSLLVKIPEVSFSPGRVSANGDGPKANEHAGKEVIADDKLLELWTTLENLGVRPYFSGGAMGGIALYVSF